MALSRAELVGLDELSARDLDAWRELSLASAEPNPFWDPDFVLPAARALGEWDEVAVARVVERSRWTACLPVRRYPRWHGLPRCIASWRHRYCLLGTPLVASEMPTAELTLLLDVMFRAGSGLVGSGLDWFDADGTVSLALEEAAPSAVALDRFDRAAVSRRTEPDYLEGSVKGKHRREFRRLAAGLEQELGGGLTLTDATGDAGAVEEFLRLEASGWKGEARTALASNPAHSEFFRQITATLGKRGLAELVLLGTAGGAVAGRHSLRAGGTSFCFKVAYDERYSRYSPGRELELRQLERFHVDPGLARMDSCTAPDNQLFNRLWPDRRHLTTLCVLSPGPLSRLTGSGLRGAVAVRNAAIRERRRRRDAHPG